MARIVTITVKGVEFPVTKEDADTLIQKGCVYVCGDCEGLHLSETCDWDHTAVAAIMLMLVAGTQASAQ